MLRYLWNDALLARFLFAHHGVGLPRPRLAICKDAHIIALEGVEQHLLSDVQVHLPLGGKAWVLRLWAARGNVSKKD